MPVNEYPHGGTGENAASSAGGNPSSAQNQVALSAGGNPSSAQIASQEEVSYGLNYTHMGGVNQPSRLTSASAAALAQSRWANGNQQAGQNRPQAPSQPRRRAPPASGPSAQQLLNLSSNRSSGVEKAHVTWDPSAPANLSCGNGEPTLSGEGRTPIDVEIRRLNEGTLVGHLRGTANLSAALSDVPTMTALSPSDEKYLLILQHGRSREQRRMEARERFRRIRSATSSAAGMIPRQPQPQRRRTPPPQPAAQPCGNCGLLGHSLAQCVTNWSLAGDIVGCYRCNTVDHIIDDCVRFPHTTDCLRFQVEVIGRAGRPPLRSRRGWNEVATARCFRGFGPISRQRMITLPRTHFDAWDYGLPTTDQTHLLVVDELTEDRAAIQAVENQGYQPPSQPTDMRGRNRVDNQPGRRLAPSGGPAATSDGHASTAASSGSLDPNNEQTRLLAREFCGLLLRIVPHGTARELLDEAEQSRRNFLAGGNYQSDRP